jgi:ABC-type phosphate/phosphonate transport system ATPase subunit
MIVIPRGKMGAPEMTVLQAVIVPDISTKSLIVKKIKADWKEVSLNYITFSCSLQHSVAIHVTFFSIVQRQSQIRNVLFSIVQRQSQLRNVLIFTSA